MALRKIIEIEGKSIVQTAFGNIENGTQRVSFLAYIKVLNFTGNKSTIGADVAFIGDTHQFVKKYEVPISLEAGALNIVAQIYTHLKTLPEFAGAADC
jgi:hypothetical protein